MKSRPGCDGSDHSCSYRGDSDQNTGSFEAALKARVHQEFVSQAPVQGLYRPLRGLGTGPATLFESSGFEGMH